MSRGQLLSAILFTLQMRLSYTMYSKMGPTASNSSHLPTKASFPESSSYPPSLCYPARPSSSCSSLTAHTAPWAQRGLVYYNYYEKALCKHLSGLVWAGKAGSMQQTKAQWWERVEAPGRCLTGEYQGQREQGLATSVVSITWTRCEGGRVQRWTHVSHAVLD